MSLVAFLAAPLTWYRERQERRRVRAELLATPGVDDVVREVMDLRYGIGNWRVTDGMVESRVQSAGQGVAWWGPIGRLGTIETSNWFAARWCELRGLDPPEVSHAKVPDPSWTPGEQADHLYSGPYDEGFYRRSYADTEPWEDDDE